MRRLQIKFPSQIRISGWDFGSSARAMNQAGGKDSLITNENELYAQAEDTKSVSLTFERKTMSTKTSIKRIALVAVAGLGFGMVSTVSANAADITAWTKYEGGVDSINLKLQTSAPTAGSAVYVNVGAVESSVGTVAGATTTGAVTQLRGFLSSYPAGAFASVSASANVEGATAGTATVPTGGAINASSNIIAIRDADDAAGLAAYSVTSTTTTGLGSFLFTPSVAGTYELKVWNDGPAVGATTIGNNQVDSNEAVQTITITVVAAAATPALSPAYSAVYAIAGNGTTAADSTSDAAGISAPKAIATANAGALTILAKNTSNAAISTVTVSASISGNGLIRVGTMTADTPTGDTCNSGGVRSVAATAADAVSTLYVCSDGNAGTGTVTVTITDTVSEVTATFTKTVTFYGAVASYKATAKKVVVGASAPSNGALTANAVEVIAYDAAGVIVPAATAYFTSSDTAKIAGAATITTSTVAEATATTPVATVGITVANSATADRYGNVTLTIQPSSTVTSPSTTVVVSLAKVEADAYTLTTDADSYAPGAKVTFTLTRTDAGRAPAGSTSGALSWTSNVGYNGTMLTDVAASLTGVSTWSVYAPSTPGTWTLTGTTVSGNAWSTALDAATFTKSIVVAVDGPTSTDAIDAANEATDAANAATDAANAAAEAADAATAAAQDAQAAAMDAQAAVAALATQVASLIAGIKAQITTLTNLVIKIQKKVKA